MLEVQGNVFLKKLLMSSVTNVLLFIEQHSL